MLGLIRRRIKRYKETAKIEPLPHGGAGGEFCKEFLSCQSLPTTDGHTQGFPPHSSLNTEEEELLLLLTSTAVDHPASSTAPKPCRVASCALVKPLALVRRIPSNDL